jgi:hypothetical protein
MTRSFPIFPFLLAGALALPAHAQDAPAPTGDKGAPPTVIKIKARTNPGDLAYEWVFDSQKLLQRALPAQARMVDFTWRITFTELSLPEQDAWQPQGWAVALVGGSFEQNVPVARGGYFLLPALPLGRQSSTIMFHEQSMPGHIGAAWRVRMDAGQRLSYAGFRQALDEIRAVQDAIPLRREGLKPLRTARYDALKACFLAPGGRVLVGGTPAGDAAIGDCVIMQFDPAKASGESMQFDGPLDVVTVVESQDYLSGMPLPPLAGTQSAALTREARAVSSDAMAAAPTNLPNLAYGWNYKRQLRIEGGPPGQGALVNFVWRLSFDGASEAEQDAWMPQGWALALARTDFARAVPVARGGYFLLPALAPSLQDAKLVFRDQDRRNVVGGAWAVRLREGERPWLYYGEIKEAIDAVHKMQDAIPENQADLAGLRAAHYDGLKACFLAPGGMLLVEGWREADASVGNCRVLKFDPKRDVNERIEFVGKLDAVTVVDTGRYTQPKS